MRRIERRIKKRKVGERVPLLDLSVPTHWGALFWLDFGSVIRKLAVSFVNAIPT
jgi:hypothetical protein